MLSSAYILAACSLGRGLITVDVSEILSCCPVYETYINCHKPRQGAAVSTPLFLSNSKCWHYAVASLARTDEQGAHLGRIPAALAEDDVTRRIR